jgi:2-methylcitrate dehydratase PrpD
LRFSCSLREGFRRVGRRFAGRIDGPAERDRQPLPIGHRRRRAEGIPLLDDKFRVNLARRFARKRQDAILDASLDQAGLEAMAVNEYVDLYAS